MLALDIFTSRKIYPYFIIKNDIKTITYRSGRPIHPIGQMSTRLVWNFLINKISPLKNEKNIFSANFYEINFYPEIM